MANPFDALLLDVNAQQMNGFPLTGACETYSEADSSTVEEYEVVKTGFEAYG